MNSTVTLAALGGTMAAAAFCLWRGLSPTRIGRVRMIPWTYIGLFGIVTTFMLLIHLLNLAGVDTSRR